jgi:hypothetical protein
VTLLLIAGAGASRRLGASSDPLPLMPDWSNRLCEVLDGREPQLAAACHLGPGMTGEQFEEALGLLLRWQQIRHLEERFAGLGGQNPGHHYGEVTVARGKTGERLGVITRALNETLYEQFGQQRVDDNRATTAYQELLRELGDPNALVVATTNYDRAAESALVGLGRKVFTGFPQRPNRVPILEPERLGSTATDVTPVIHLHGAVGWYEKDGQVRDHMADQPYLENLGSPVVLYPDPGKDPTNDATVSGLWSQFRAALDQADHVFVLGHSLHDPALVGAIAAAKPRKLAVTVFNDDEVARVEQLLPGAIVVRTDFGPELDIDRAAVAGFRG